MSGCCMSVPVIYY